MRGWSTRSTRAGNPLAVSRSAWAWALARSESARGGASGSGDVLVDGISASSTQRSDESCSPRVIRVNVTPGCRRFVVRVSGRSAGPRSRCAEGAAAVAVETPATDSRAAVASPARAMVREGGIPETLGTARGRSAASW